MLGRGIISFSGVSSCELPLANSSLPVLIHATLTNSVDLNKDMTVGGGLGGKKEVLAGGVEVGNKRRQWKRCSQYIVFMMEIVKN